MTNCTVYKYFKIDLTLNNKEFDILTETLHEADEAALSELTNIPVEDIQEFLDSLYNILSTYYYK